MESVVEVVKLSKRYGRQVVLEDVEFRIERGQCVGLLGANGAGKSTLLRIITGLVQPTSGTVSLFGQLEPPYWSVAHRIGALIERESLYPYLTAAEHLALVCRLRGIPPQRSRVVALLERVGLAEAADKRVRTYSYGMRQRLALAIALVGDPELLVLDEPVNGLDPEGILLVRELIRSLHAQGVTIIVSSHLLAELEHIVTRVILLHRGRVLADDSIDALLHRYQRSVTIETEEPAAEVATILAPHFPILQLYESAVHVEVEPERLPALVTLLVSRGIHIRALVPERSLEQLYFHLAADKQ